MTVLLKNNVASTITSTINASDVGITVASGTGALFPTITGGDYFYATLTSTGGTQEIVKVSARAGDSMTIARGQDNTTAQSFASGSRIEMRVNVAAVQDYALTSSNVVLTENFSWYSVKDFGAAGDGVTNDDDAINAGLTYVKANGGTLWFPDGVYICKEIRLDENTKYYSMVGGGKERVTLKHVDGSCTMLTYARPTDPIGFTVQGFTLDLQYSVYLHPDANNGIAIRQASNVTIRDVHITDHYNHEKTYLYGDNSVIDCSNDGKGIAGNGFLFSEMHRCSYLRVHAKGVVDRGTDAGPGIGVQFKNNCTWGTATDIIVEDSNSAFGLAGDTGGTVQGPSYITATNIKADNCKIGIRIGNATTHCSITNAVLSHDVTSNSDVIRITNYSYGNTLSNINIVNVAPTKRAVFFETASTDNNVHIAILDTALSGAPVVVFNDTCAYNNVRLSRALNPRLRTASTLDGMATFEIPSSNNSFTYDNYPYQTDFPIVAGVIVLANAIMEQYCTVDTEGGAATDDLDTITNHYQQEGQRIIIRTDSGVRDVTVRHLTGNIYLAGGVDFTLANNRSMLCLIWNTDYSKWVEAFRVTSA